MKKTRLMIVISVFITIMMVAFCSNSVEAKEVFDDGSFGFSDFKTNHSLYCRQHGTKYRDKVNSLEKKYRVRTFACEISVQGDNGWYTVPGKKRLVLSGDIYNRFSQAGEGTVDTKKYGTTKNKLINATIVGYTIDNGEGYQSSAQKTIWNKHDIFTTVLGISSGAIDGGGETSTRNI